MKHLDKETQNMAIENKQNSMKKAVVENVVKNGGNRTVAEKFTNASTPKMIRTMYHNIKSEKPRSNPDDVLNNRKSTPEQRKQAAISKMTPEQREAVMSGKTYRHVNKYGVTDITKNDLDARDDSTPRTKKMEIGSPVKVKVNGGREGKIVGMRGDVVTVEMPASGNLPARRDTYYKSDLE